MMVQRTQNHYFWFLSPLLVAIAVGLAAAKWRASFDSSSPEESNRVIQSELLGNWTRLIRISCDIIPKDQFFLTILTDENSMITGIGFQGAETNESFSVDQLQAGVPMNIPSKNIPAGANPVAFFRSPDFHPAHGGEIELKYLKNAITRSMQSLRFRIQKDGAQWRAYQSNGLAFNHAHLQANTVFGKAVGIGGAQMSMIQN